MEKIKIFACSEASEGFTKEICDYLGLSSVTYAIQTHVMPLVESGLIKMSIPDKPKSPKQLFYSE